MYSGKKYFGLSFASAFFMLAHFSVSFATTSNTYLRGEISHLRKFSAITHLIYDERILENDGSHSGHSHSGPSHSGSGDESEDSDDDSDTSDESEYQMNMGSTTDDKASSSTVVVVCASTLYAAVAIVLFLLIRSDKNNESDLKNAPLVNKEEVELVNSFSKVTQKHRRQTSDGSDALTYVVDETVSLPSMETINEEKKLAEKCCLIIGVNKPTGLTSYSNSFAVV